MQVHRPRGDGGFDFIGVRDNQRWVIEVKFYRTARAQPSLLETAAVRVAVAGHKQDINRGMLVVSCSLPDPLRNSIQKRYGIALVDRFDLIQWAGVIARPGPILGVAA